MTEAFERGVSHGWDARNFAEAYGTTESREDEAARRAQDNEASDEDRAAYARGFSVGWNRFEADLWSDGTPRDVDDEEGG